MDKLLVGQRILVVEDEMLIVMALEDMLGDLGCESIAAAASIEQAIALIDSKPFDAALLDVNLNGEDSSPIADELVARGIPFVVSTGNISQNIGAAFRGRPLLKKPFQDEQLAGILGRLFAIQS